MSDTEFDVHKLSTTEIGEGQIASLVLGYPVPLQGVLIDAPFPKKAFPVIVQSLESNVWFCICGTSLVCIAVIELDN